MFIIGLRHVNALTVYYNVLLLINSKVGIGYEKALRSQSTVPFFYKFIKGLKQKNPKFRLRIWDLYFEDFCL